jgi:hypothetical protein
LNISFKKTKTHLSVDLREKMFSMTLAITTNPNVYFIISNVSSIYSS